MKSLPENRPMSNTRWFVEPEPFWPADDHSATPVDPESDWNPLANAIDAEITRFEALGTPTGMLMAIHLAGLAMKVRLTDTIDPTTFDDNLAKLDAEIKHQKTAAGPCSGLADRDEFEDLMGPCGGLAIDIGDGNEEILEF